mmetsp:Transcript_11076/g.34204  ORF Transcript_11076/g.34204 Transcript_11076/m.34204 type:complete len:351 (-) Transcript_11076:320-1372(-)
MLTSASFLLPSSGLRGAGAPSAPRPPAGASRTGMGGTTAVLAAGSSLLWYLSWTLWLHLVAATAAENDLAFAAVAASRDGGDFRIVGGLAAAAICSAATSAALGSELPLAGRVPGHPAALAGRVLPEVEGILTDVLSNIQSRGTAAGAVSVAVAAAEEASIRSAEARLAAWGIAEEAAICSPLATPSMSVTSRNFGVCASDVGDALKRASSSALTAFTAAWTAISARSTAMVAFAIAVSPSAFVLPPLGPPSSSSVSRAMAIAATAAGRATVARSSGAPDALSDISEAAWLGRAAGGAGVTVGCGADWMGGEGIGGNWIGGGGCASGVRRGESSEDALGAAVGVSGCAPV